MVLNHIDKAGNEQQKAFAYSMQGLADEARRLKLNFPHVDDLADTIEDTQEDDGPIIPIGGGWYVVMIV